MDGAKDTVGKIGRVFGDSAYDSRANFNKAASISTAPVINPRKNSSGKGILNTARGGRSKRYSPR